MSLPFPGVVTFYKDENVVKRLTIRFDWFTNDYIIKEGIKMTLIDYGEVFDWDEAEVHGKKFNKSDIIP